MDFQKMSEWKKEKPEYYEFAILYEDKHIGAVSIYFENKDGELGMGTTHFIAYCDTENIASYKVMEKLCMISEN